MDETLAMTSGTEADRGRLFTVEEADRALVLVRRVVEDIVARYGDLMRMRDEYAALSRHPGSERSIELRAQIEQTVGALYALSDELTEVGCVLKDWSTGLVDFPAVRQGEKIWLCWKLGEPAVAHWHGWEAGFSGRTPLESEVE